MHNTGSWIQNGTSWAWLYTWTNIPYNAHWTRQHQEDFQTLLIQTLYLSFFSNVLHVIIWWLWRSLAWSIDTETWHHATEQPGETPKEWDRSHGYLFGWPGSPSGNRLIKDQTLPDLYEMIGGYPRCFWDTSARIQNTWDLYWSLEMNVRR